MGRTPGVGGAPPAMRDFREVGVVAPAANKTTGRGDAPPFVCGSKSGGGCCINAVHTIREIENQLKYDAQDQVYCRNE